MEFAQEDAMNRADIGMPLESRLGELPMEIGYRDLLDGE